MPTRFLFFDVGNTLLFPNRTNILAPLLKHGNEPTLEQWHVVERHTKPEFDRALQENARIDHGFWWLFYTELLDGLKIVPSNGSHDVLRNALMANTQRAANWDQIRPGTREALERLRREYRIAVISNSDGKIAEVLARCGIADCFETITDSGIVGCEKPNAAIFQAALTAMKAPAAESLYVGDIYSVDYVGARSAGMQAILFDVAGAYHDREVPRVDSLVGLEAWLKQ